MDKISKFILGNLTCENSPQRELHEFPSYTIDDILYVTYSMSHIMTYVTYGMGDET